MLVYAFTRGGKELERQGAVLGIKSASGPIITLAYSYSIDSK
jgi:hypothetical protein